MLIKFQDEHKNELVIKVPKDLKKYGRFHGRHLLFTEISYEDEIENRTILEEANELIYGDRAQAYGPVTASFTRIARFWSVILDTEVTAEQVGLCMVALKMSRQISKSDRDNLVDGAGYFGCIAKMNEERNPQQ